MRGCQEGIPRTKSDLTEVSKLNSIYSCRRMPSSPGLSLPSLLIPREEQL